MKSQICPLYSLLPDEIEKRIDLEKNFRYSQLFSWIYKKQIESFDKMKNMPEELRKRCRAKFEIMTLKEKSVIKSKRTNAVKRAFQTEDGHIIESVVMRDDEGKTSLCISSQIGCPYACTFCATGMNVKYIRSLDMHEIIEQYVLCCRQLRDAKIDRIVFMGMGEPLLNYNNVIRSVELLTSPKAFSYSPKRITISTVGHIKGINDLASSAAQVNLAVSLHSADQDVRNRLLPDMKGRSLDVLKKALVKYQERKKSPLFIENVLVKDINDSVLDAKKLAAYLGDLKVKVNIIAYNKIRGSIYRSPQPQRIKVFREVLEKAGYTVIQRYKRGDDIAAGCGQLAGLE
ncbi:23S rRNA (adenine(2503)-C(2))-methyltransferase RlmN [Spirochaetota bacterium]